MQSRNSFFFFQFFMFYIPVAIEIITCPLLSDFLLNSRFDWQRDAKFSFFSFNTVMKLRTAYYCMIVHNTIYT